MMTQLDGLRRACDSADGAGSQCVCREQFPTASLGFRDAQLESAAGDLTQWSQPALWGGWLPELRANFCRKTDSER